MFRIKGVGVMKNEEKRLIETEAKLRKIVDRKHRTFAARLSSLFVNSNWVLSWKNGAIALETNNMPLAKALTKVAQYHDYNSSEIWLGEGSEFGSRAPFGELSHCDVECKEELEEDGDFFIGTPTGKVSCGLEDYEECSPFSITLLLERIAPHLPNLTVDTESFFDMVAEINAKLKKLNKHVIKINARKKGNKNVRNNRPIQQGNHLR